MEGSKCLYYMNLAMNKTRLVFQRSGPEGETVFLLLRGNSGRDVQIFDPASGKSTRCALKKKHTPSAAANNQLLPGSAVAAAAAGSTVTFSTVTNSEKLAWTDGAELRVLRDRLVGASGAEDGLLCAYLVREARGADGFDGSRLLRWRLRLGGRGLGKVDLVVGSFLAVLMLHQTLQ
ncbi:hypothetical protein HDU84_002973 [Entophlyctis sp. JEL0112]|nr:hypothetical protein HDU84_002973 [Entophlyctis sp. JEL0112]